MMRPGRFALGLGVALAACGSDASEPAATRRAGPVVSERASVAPPALAPEVRRHIDQGNTAFELEDWAGALEHYEAAVGADENSPAGWFGVWMALTELGDAARAQEARARLEELARPRPGDPHAGTTREDGTTGDRSQQEGGA